eukprot:243317_1
MFPSGRVDNDKGWKLLPIFGDCEPNSDADADLDTDTASLDHERKTNQFQIICDDESVGKCDSLRRLSDVMELYSQYNNEQKKTFDFDVFDAINTAQILDDYIHLLHHHDDDVQFQFIFKTLPQCNMAKCTGLRRNHRNRCQSKSNTHESTINLEILDKIHCYFIHSYDVGYRLTADEREKIAAHLDVDTSNGASVGVNFINKELLHMSQIISHKRELCKRYITTLEHRCIRQCTQLQSVTSSNTGTNLFHFGMSFVYGHTEENEGDISTHNLNKVSPRHESLIKDELINNKFCILTTTQFNRELDNAWRHLNSRHCKQSFPPKNDRVLNIEQILSSMVYCNYTHLQSEFSKTYRMDSEKACVSCHSEFYHLGKNLKSVVRIFGTTIGLGNAKTFYHGLDQVLQFPETFQYGQAGVCIHCPVSMSVSLPIAVCFACSGNHCGGGAVIEFSGEWRHEAQYFSMKWLSDFPAEKEYLFIQNEERPILIMNITHCQTGYSYGIILEALKVINMITDGTRGSDSMVIEPAMENIVVRIIHHQLSLTNSSYKPFESITKYASEIIDRYFRNCYSKRTINYWFMKQLQPKNTQLFEYERIDVRKVVELYPLVSRIHINYENTCVA